MTMHEDVVPTANEVLQWEQGRRNYHVWSASSSFGGICGDWELSESPDESEDEDNKAPTKSFEAFRILATKPPEQKRSSETLSKRRVVGPLGEAGNLQANQEKNRDRTSRGKRRKDRCPRGISSV